MSAGIETVETVIAATEAATEDDRGLQECTEAIEDHGVKR